jgi:hypothetical protein
MLEQNNNGLFSFIANIAVVSPMTRSSHGKF